MSETLFKFLLSEVQVVRITCRRDCGSGPCNGTIEVPLSRLSRAKRCPVCQEEFHPSDQHSFGAFMRIMEALVELEKKAVTVELVLPATVGKPSA